MSDWLIGAEEWYGLTLEGGACRGRWRWAFRCGSSWRAQQLAESILRPATIIAIDGPYADLDAARSGQGPASPT